MPVCAVSITPRTMCILRDGEGWQIIRNTVEFRQSEAPTDPHTVLSWYPSLVQYLQALNTKSNDRLSKRLRGRHRFAVNKDACGCITSPTRRITVYYEVTVTVTYYSTVVHFCHTRVIEFEKGSEQVT